MAAEAQKEEYVKICSLENTFEAQLVSSILNERAVPHRILSHHDTAYDGLFQAQKGWGDILAPPGFKNFILETVRQVRSETFEPDELK